MLIRSPIRATRGSVQLWGKHGAPERALCVRPLDHPRGVSADAGPRP